MKKTNIWALLLPVIFLMAACKSDYARFENPVSQEEIDHNAIVNHLSEHGVKAKKTESGLFYTITDGGNGKKASKEKGDHLAIHFKAYKMDSTVFRSTYDDGEPLDFTYATMFKGLEESVNLLSEKGKGTFYMPSGIAFGPQGIPGVVPPNTPTVFDIEIVGIKDSVQVAAERAEAEAKARAEAAALAVKDDETIQAHIKEKGWKAEKTEEGVYYVVEKSGGAQKPTLRDEVTCHYTGTLLDGTKFDSSHDRGQPATFPLGRVVPGWQIGIPKFGKGGKGKLLIPSGLGYGPRGAGADIPPNSILVFEIEVVDIMDEAAILKRQEEQRKKQEEQRKKMAAEAEAQKGKDDKILQDYFKKNNLKPQKTPEGVYYIVDEAGAEKPTLQNKVTVHYEGTLLNGSKFDSSYDRGEPTTFPLGGVVKGWQIGIPQFGKGGKGTIYIPSGLAYGPRGTGDKIPPNSCLVFKIELLDIQGAPVQ